MLQSVFKELYDQGILIFLDAENYVTNNVDIDPVLFADRKQFIEMYNEPIESGWVFCYTENLNKVLTTIKEDTCFLIEFGFNSDTEKKALEVGRALVNALIKHEFMTNWTEETMKDHKISTVITIEDLPEKIQDMFDDYDEA